MNERIAYIAYSGSIEVKLADSHSLLCMVARVYRL